MGESTYAAMREFIRVAVELEGRKIREEMRASPPTETRAVEPVVGPAGKDGKDGKDGAPSTVPGPKGEPGERGKDGMVTREEMEAEIEKRVADINVRTFADTYKGVFKPDELYTRGVLTTWGGSLWLSLVDTKRKPGDNNTDWKLVVKK